MEHDTQTLFTQLGIPGDAGHIYHALLEHGHMGVSDIGRVTKLYRPQIYELLGLLTELGLVTKRDVGKRIHYEAAHPKALTALADRVASRVHDLVPQLTRLYVSEPSVAVRTLLGREGLEAAYMDVVLSLPSGGMFYHYSAVRDQTLIDSYVPREYREVRDRKALERLTIASAHAGSHKQPRLERYLKVLTKDAALFGQNVDMFIYDTRVSTLSFDAERAIIIDDSAVADFQKRVFMTLFNSLS